MWVTLRATGVREYEEHRMKEDVPSIPRPSVLSLMDCVLPKVQPLSAAWLQAVPDQLLVIFWRGKHFSDHCQNKLHIQRPDRIPEVCALTSSEDS